MLSHLVPVTRGIGWPLWASWARGGKRGTCGVCPGAGCKPNICIFLPLYIITKRKKKKQYFHPILAILKTLSDFSHAFKVYPGNGLLSRRHW